VRTAHTDNSCLSSRFLLNHHALSSQLRHLRQTLASAETHLLLSTSLLQHLESTNVYNDAFQIGYVPLPSRTDNPAMSHVGAGSSSGSGYVGTINGLRLGGRPTVDWDEINAAWGLVALCVDRVAARVGFTFAQ
jgi:beclin 1